MRRSNKRLFGTSGLLILAITLAGCTRSASTPPPEAETTESPSGDAMRATMEAVRSLMLTQTAEAEGGEQQSATPTPTLVLPTETEAPATLTPVVVIDTPTPEPGGYEEYTVQPGDYLYSIARKFDVDPEDIIAINNLQAPDTLEVGQVLLIPLGDVATGPTRTPITGAQEYIVQAGDWIWSIARKFGLDAQALIDANDLEYPYTVYPGDVLIIP